MEIVIEKGNVAEYIIETNKIHFRQSIKTFYRFYLFLLVFGFIFLFAGINQGGDNTTTYSEYFDKINKTEVTTNVYNYHILFGLGVGFIIVFLFFVILSFRRKKHFFKSVNNLSNKQKKLNNIYTFKINNTGISYQDFEVKYEVSWSIYLQYKVDPDYLLFFTDNQQHSPTMIPIKGLNNIELENLLKIVAEKLPGKRMISKSFASVGKK